MEAKVLYIQVVNDEEKVVNFPLGASEPIRLDKITYTAQRMGGAPNITADFYYPRILDNEWTHREFVEFRGERYYVDATPSAEKDNTTLLYKHSVTLVSERILLEHEFFYDVVTDETEAVYADRYRSNIAKFSFYGDIREFVARINDSLVYTKMCKVTTDDEGNKIYDGYHVVIDDIVVDTDDNTYEVSVENKRISEVLQEINTTFKLAYYFVGKEIHVGYTENVIDEQIFEYGRDGGLLKIQHTNSNEAIVDRITGVGSSDNLPYYYPNLTPDGLALYEVKNSGIEGQDVVESVNMTQVYKFLIDPFNKPLQLHHRTQNPHDNLKFRASLRDIEFSSYHDEVGAAIAWVSRGGNKYFVAQKGDYVGGNDANVDLVVNAFQDVLERAYPSVTFQVIKTDVNIFSQDYYSTSWGERRKRQYTREELLALGRSAAIKELDGNDWAYPISGDAWHEFEDEERFYISVNVTFRTNVDYLIPWGKTQKLTVPEIPVTFYISHLYENESGYYFTYKDNGEEKRVIYEESGIVFQPDVIDKLNRKEHTCHYDDEKGFVEDPADETQPATEITITGRKWINPTQKLMPSIYRDSLGAERYYNAAAEGDYNRTFENIDGLVTKSYESAYKIGGTDDHYKFENIYDANNPHADYQEFDDIKPTIKGVRNDIIRRLTTDGTYSDAEDADYVTDEDGNYTYENTEKVYKEDGTYDLIPVGQLLGEVVDVAFDEHDSDLIQPTSQQGEGEYLHSYFYIKLRKFSGDMGFNIFDYASESDTAKILMTSGNCAGCSFEIGVPEPTAEDIQEGKYKFTNGVQVKDDGNIVDGDYTGGSSIREGDFGDKVRLDNPQPIQQDTSKAEVWIALKKETSTFGVVMPNHNQNYRPQKGDTFVISGIKAPLSYITAAEKRLDKALVKYMSEHNTEKFSYAITLSRIWLAEHPAIAAKLNENARLYVKYNGMEVLLYVTNYSVKTDGNILEEISVTLADNIDDTAQASLTAKLNAVKDDILTTVANQDYTALISIMRKYFLNRKEGAAKADRTMLSRAIFSRGADTTDIHATEELRSDKNVVAVNFETPDFEDNIHLGHGAAMHTDQYGKTHIQTDYLEVRTKATFNELEVNHVSHVAGDKIYSCAGNKISAVVPIYKDESYAPSENPIAFRCYFAAEDGENEVENMWKVGDQAFCQSSNIKALGSSGQFTTRRYWRLVTGVGSEEIEQEDGTKKKFNYVDLSNSDTVAIDGKDGYVGYDLENSNDTPKDGDSIVQLGSQTDTSRQYAKALYISTAQEVTYDGINGFGELSRFVVFSESPEKIEYQADKFVLTSGKNNEYRETPILFAGEWAEGTQATHWVSFTYEGEQWLCVLPTGEYTTEAPSEDATTSDGHKIWLKTTKKGEDGVAGKDAVIYKLRPSVEAIHFHRDADGNITNDNQEISVGYCKITGSTQENFEGPLKEATYEDGTMPFLFKWYFSNGSTTNYIWLKNLQKYTIKIASASSYTMLEIIMAKKFASSSDIKDSNIVDRVFIPISYDGEKGAQGEQGEKGADGINGADGKDGVNGKDGKDGADMHWNLIRGTKDLTLVGQYPKTGYKDYGRFLVPCEGNAWVLSFDAKSTVEEDILVTHLYDPSDLTYPQRDGYTEHELTTEFKRYTALMRGPSAEARTILFRFTAGDGTGIVTIKNIKFESGDTATEYCGAEADLDAWEVKASPSVIRCTTTSKGVVLGPDGRELSKQSAYATIAKYKNGEAVGVVNFSKITTVNCNADKALYGAAIAVQSIDKTGTKVGEYDVPYSTASITVAGTFDADGETRDFSVTIPIVVDISMAWGQQVLTNESWTSTFNGLKSDVEGKMSTYESNLKQTADSITAEVSKKVSSDDVATAISNATSSFIVKPEGAGLMTTDANGTVATIGTTENGVVKLSGENIKLEGYTSINKGVTIDEKGYLHANKAILTNLYQPWANPQTTTAAGDNWYGPNAILRVKARLSNVGRVIRFTPADFSTQYWKDMQNYGYIAYGDNEDDDTNTYYFYEDGIRKKYLSLGNDVIELIGLGTDTEFRGYAVLNRINLVGVPSANGYSNDRIGREAPVLVYGKITGSSSGVKTEIHFPEALSASMRTVHFKVERTGTGAYKITSPYSKLGYPMVSGLGVMAMVGETTDTYFTVKTYSPGGSATDGAFYISLMSSKAWTFMETVVDDLE